MEDPAEDMSEADTDARMAVAKLEQEKLENKICIQKKFQMLEALECENKRLQDELAQVESESDGARSMLRAPGGSQQQSSDGKIRKRKQPKTKVKARIVMSNNTSSMPKTRSKQSTRSNITDLWHNLTLCN